MINAVGDAASHSTSGLEHFGFQHKDASDKELKIDVLFCGFCLSDPRHVKKGSKSAARPPRPWHQAVARVMRAPCLASARGRDRDARQAHRGMTR